uniref:AlNc14C298G10346 protein n=1 Tax=Albugo laibachii Nc14 TaxID=890382 RepID=F0WVL1_9STRA|nr:AlNc14C298G10346 [Albugo laibachii Nc14]|eukprot:CCA25453.1 AlNc14C298G10346 [Albugo laibachii Nc14]
MTVNPVSTRSHNNDCPMIRSHVRWLSNLSVMDLQSLQLLLEVGKFRQKTQ